MNKFNLNNLTTEERELALKILSEYSNNGKSDLLSNLVNVDWNEYPVDIETFITNDNYLGKAWKDTEGNLKLYPFWLEKLKELFPTPTSTKYTTVLETGARGLGKSEIAAGIIAPYQMYRILCMKNALRYYGLKPTEKIVFAFMNIKLDLAEGIATEKFQKTIQMSPWFMQKGRMTQMNNLPYWVPPDPVNIVIGSQSDDVIGLPIYFCLDGDTRIITDSGICSISSLENKDIRVYNIDERNEVVLSNICTVKQTFEGTEEYHIELEDGTVIKCTPNHRLMLKDGTYKEAKYLNEDDELMDTNYFGYIYKFTMIPTNKIYIGKREKSKFDESYYGSGREWKKDLAKYGKENVKREILCWGFNREDLNEKEIYWISKLDATNKDIGYNIHKGGAGGNSLNDKEAWSALHLGPRNGRYGKQVLAETRDKISKANTGKVRSQEFKDNVSLKLKGVKKPAGFGEKVSKAQKGRKHIWSYKRVICIEKNICYDSAIFAEKELGVCRQNISYCCRHSDRTAGGYHWRYANEN